MDRYLLESEVVKAVDRHTGDDGRLDDDITCILEEVGNKRTEEQLAYWCEYPDMFYEKMLGYKLYWWQNFYLYLQRCKRRRINK